MLKVFFSLEQVFLWDIYCKIVNKCNNLVFHLFFANIFETFGESYDIFFLWDTSIHIFMHFVDIYYQCVVHIFVSRVDSPIIWISQKHFSNFFPVKSPTLGRCSISRRLLSYLKSFHSHWRHQSYQSCRIIPATPGKKNTLGL